jgi:hypothetical protein
MPALFGYRIEPGFNIAREQRRDRLNWLFYTGVVLCIAYSFFSGRGRSTEIFQSFVATTLFYGETFYVRQRCDLGKLWIWKAIITTIPLHVLYLLGIFWSDRAYPDVMTKAIIFIPVLALGSAVEFTQMQRIVTWFKPGVPGTDPTPGRVD